MQSAGFDRVLFRLKQNLKESLATECSDGELLDRFARVGDVEAFGMILRRHGLMVWRTCLRTLGHGHDAEDAFQAVFLVLARDAKSIRRRSSLGGWLHGVACRIARKLQRNNAIRRRHESAEIHCKAKSSFDGDASWREMLGVLDKEMERLPLRLREPLVLCYLEGLTQDEAARRLGFSLSTFRRRMTRAKKVLRLRLTLRGCTLSTALLSPLAAECALPVQLSPGLIRSTIDAVQSPATGKTLSAAVATPVVTLMKGTTNMTIWKSPQFAMILVLSIGLLGFGLLGPFGPIAAQSGRQNGGAVVGLSPASGKEANAKEPANLGIKSPAARANVLKQKITDKVKKQLDWIQANLEHLSIELKVFDKLHGAADPNIKLSRLWLSVPQLALSHALNGKSADARIGKQQAAKIIQALAKDGDTASWLARTPEDVKKILAKHVKEETRCVLIDISFPTLRASDAPRYRIPLPWNPATTNLLDGVRNCMDGKAAKMLTLFLWPMPQAKDASDTKPNGKTPIELVKAATSRVGFPAEGFPVLPSLSTEMRGHVCNEIAKSSAVRSAYEQLDVANRRNTDWFAGVAELEKQKAVWGLQSCLCHPSEDVQIHALRSLERLGDKRAVPFLVTYAEYMAVPESGSENATIHGVIHRSVAKTLSALTGIEVVINGQDSAGLKRGIKRWRRWLVLLGE